MKFTFTRIGKLIKTHGLNGDISIRVDEVYMGDLLNTEKVFIENHGQKIPYFIDGLKTNNSVLIKLEDISCPEDAHDLTNKILYLDDSDVTVQLDNYDHLEYGALIGFTVKNNDGTIIGLIDEIIEYPQQEMAQLVINDKKQLLPLVDEFIVRIDPENKIITVNLPEGILDL